MLLCCFCVGPVQSHAQQVAQLQAKVASMSDTLQKAREEALKVSRNP